MSDFFSWVMLSLTVFILAFIFVFVGVRSSEERYQRRCVEKYSDMPHGKVGKFCEELLKFKKEVK